MVKKTKKKKRAKKCRLCGATLSKDNKTSTCFFHGFIDPKKVEI